MQERRGRLLLTPVCVVCLCACECSQSDLSSRGLLTGRVWKTPQSFCTSTKAVAKEKPLSGEAVQFFCSSCDLTAHLCPQDLHGPTDSPHIMHYPMTWLLIAHSKNTIWLNLNEKGNGYTSVLFPLGHL